MYHSLTGAFVIPFKNMTKYSRNITRRGVIEFSFPKVYQNKQLTDLWNHMTRSWGLIELDVIGIELEISTPN